MWIIQEPNTLELWNKLHFEEREKIIQEPNTLELWNKLHFEEREKKKSLYEGQLISNAHSEIFCQRSKVAMRAQCVLVATTLLHSGAKFHSFLYNGSNTVRVNVESCYGGMSTRLKQRAVTEFLSAENVTPAEIHRRLQAVYGEYTVNRTTVNRRAIKFSWMWTRSCRYCWPNSQWKCKLTKSLHDRIFGSW